MFSSKLFFDKWGNVQVFFTGYISQKELLKKYLHAKCIVIPSLYEGTPNRVAIEALALGKLIITTSIPGMESILSNRLGSVVPPKNHIALARAIAAPIPVGPCILCWHP